MTSRGAFYLGSLLVLVGSHTVMADNPQDCTPDHPLGCCDTTDLAETLPAINCVGVHEILMLPAPGCLSQMFEATSPRFYCPSGPYSPANWKDLRASPVADLECLRDFAPNKWGIIDVVNVLRSLCSFIGKKDFRTRMKRCVREPGEPIEYECFYFVETPEQLTLKRLRNPTYSAPAGTPEPTNGARVPVPGGRACDQSPNLTHCADCSIYFDPRPGYGNTEGGRCVWVPAERKCFPNAWARRQGMKVNEHCRAKEFANIVVPTLWNDDDAKYMCPDYCRSQLGVDWVFTGKWWQCGEKKTPCKQGSVCRCRWTRQPTQAPSTAKLFENIVVSTLWNDDDAKHMCPEYCQSQLGVNWMFTGKWWQCGEKKTPCKQGSVCRCWWTSSDRPMRQPTKAPSTANKMRLGGRTLRKAAKAAARANANETDYLEAPEQCLSDLEYCDPHDDKCCPNLACKTDLFDWKCWPTN